MSESLPATQCNVVVLQRPEASALGVGDDGRLVYVGSSQASVHVAKAAEIVDLQGGFVTPGFIDSHVHLINGGLSLTRLTLRDVRSKQDFISRVCAAAAGLREGQWLLGGAWDESQWGGELPAAAWVDGCTRHTPLWLHRMDAHMGLANSAALRLAGVDSTTADPKGGVIVRDGQGEPTGLLADNAMTLVMAHIPPVSLQQRQAAFTAATQHALAQGITMVHDMGRLAFQEGEEAAWEDLEGIYLPAADAGDLPLRLYSFVALTTWRRMAERVRHVGTLHPGGRLRWGGVKEFSDGSLGSHTALMHEPYADNPSSKGTRTIDLEVLRDLVERADAADLQVAIHAIGDRAVDDVLEIYASLPAAGASLSGSSSGAKAAAAAAAAGPPRSKPRRHRIEHAQHVVGPSTAHSMAAAGVLATPNPLHLLADAAILESRLGAARAGPGRSYAFKTLLKAGVGLAFATDWPVVPLDALSTLHAAVLRGSSQPSAPPTGTDGDRSTRTVSGSGNASSSSGSDQQQGAPSAGRQAEDSGGAAVPAGTASAVGGSSAAAAGAPTAAGSLAGAEPEALSYGEALRAHTLAGAMAGLWEGDVGVLRPGMLADFVVLSGPLESKPQVLQTYVDGQCMYGCSN
ncbi:hypothetical protein N2152v2_004616 [Parachlorella kessleri]